MKTYKTLTAEEEAVILKKGTERPFTGKYNLHFEAGTYQCKQCGADLYQSEDKFNSHCGWPAFDDEIAGSIKRIPDADGMRTEIVCAACHAHLGHVFEGEGLTDKNVRHCVNSISLDFVPFDPAVDTAIFAGGCFWGVEHLMRQKKGVISAVSGYTGGTKENPSYEEVLAHQTGHAEAVRVIFNPEEISYEALARYFFEIHDPTQLDRQGPDVGEQYRSEIFYRNEEQKKISEQLINILEQKGLSVTTRLSPASVFYPAEAYHQEYYRKAGGMPYCHRYTKRF